MKRFTEKHIKKLQAFLRDNGFYSFDEGSGLLDDYTVFAWKQYQNSKGVQPPADVYFPLDAEALPEEIRATFEKSDYFSEEKSQENKQTYAHAPGEALISAPQQNQHLTKGDASAYKPVADNPTEVPAAAEPAAAEPAAAAAAELAAAEPAAAAAAEPAAAEPAAAELAAAEPAAAAAAEPAAAEPAAAEPAAAEPAAAEPAAAEPEHF